MKGTNSHSVFQDKNRKGKNQATFFNCSQKTDKISYLISPVMIEYFK